MDTPDRLEAAIGSIPSDWLRALGPSASPERLAPIAEYVAAQRQSTCVLPDPERVFAALAATPIDSVRAVILGQDPYPTRSHAMGLAFSVPARWLTLSRGHHRITWTAVGVDGRSRTTSVRLRVR